jgi:hypothetical protein
MSDKEPGSGTGTGSIALALQTVKTVNAMKIRERVSIFGYVI